MLASHLVIREGSVEFLRKRDPLWTSVGWMKEDRSLYIRK